jgi:hypothetical protein
MTSRSSKRFVIVAAQAAQHCVVESCRRVPVAEVHCEDYCKALELFRGVRRDKLRSRRRGGERFFLCERHLDDPRMAVLRWQLLIVLQGEP